MHWYNEDGKISFYFPSNEATHK
ncbi:tryptophanase leader peptide [Vibrio tapetis]